MAVISFKFDGVDAAIKNIGSKIKQYENEIQDELNVWALETATLAKQYAPVHEGQLRGSINANFDGKLKASVTVAVNYAAYIEFGTKKFGAAYVSTLPNDWATFASQYKGSGGGSFEQFVKNITEWVRLKGIPIEAAYPIARKILRDGIKPHPYLYPAFVKTKPELIENIKKVLSQ